MVTRMKPSGFRSLIHTIFLQLKQESRVSKWMRSTVFQYLSRSIGVKNERNWLFLRVKEAADRVMNIKAERGDFRLQLNDYKVSKEN